MSGPCDGCTKPVRIIHGENGYDRIDGTVCQVCSRWYTDYYTPVDHEHDYYVMELRDNPAFQVCRLCGKSRNRIENDRKRGI